MVLSNPLTVRERTEGPLALHGGTQGRRRRFPGPRPGPPGSRHHLPASWQLMSRQHFYNQVPRTGRRRGKASLRARASVGARSESGRTHPARGRGVGWAWGGGGRGSQECISPGSSPVPLRQRGLVCTPHAANSACVVSVHTSYLGVLGGPSAPGDTVAPSQSCGCGSWELGLGRIWELPCQGVGLALTSFYKNVVSPQLPNFWGLDSPAAGGAVPGASSLLWGPLGPAPTAGEYLGLDHAWPLVPQVLQGGCDVDLFSACKTPIGRFRWGSPGDRPARPLSGHVPRVRGPRPPSAGGRLRRFPGHSQRLRPGRRAWAEESHARHRTDTNASQRAPHSLDPTARRLHVEK